MYYIYLISLVLARDGQTVKTGMVFINSGRYRPGVCPHVRIYVLCIRYGGCVYVRPYGIMKPLFLILALMEYFKSVSWLLFLTSMFNRILPTSDSLHFVLPTTYCPTLLFGLIASRVDRVGCVCACTLCSHAGILP